MNVKHNIFLDTLKANLEEEKNIIEQYNKVLEKFGEKPVTFESIYRLNDEMKIYISSGRTDDIR